MLVLGLLRVLCLLLLLLLLSLPLVLMEEFDCLALELSFLSFFLPLPPSTDLLLFVGRSDYEVLEGQFPCEEGEAGVVPWGVSEKLW